MNIPILRGPVILAFLSLWFFSEVVQALTTEEIMQRTRIVNLEASPRWFVPGQPIDFVVTVNYKGGTQDGFDVAVYHEHRLVGLVRDQRFNRGSNTFKVRDRHFKGDPGDYIVQLRFKGKVFTRKSFATSRKCEFTINPQRTR
jgi:hypothetical protein